MSFVDQMKDEVQPLVEQLEQIHLETAERLGSKGAGAGAILGAAIHIWMRAGGTEAQAQAVVNTVYAIIKGKDSFDGSPKEESA